MQTTSLRRRLLVGVIPLALLAAACGDDDDASPSGTTSTTGTDDGVSVSFTEPSDGDHVAGAVHVVMSATGITIEPAGEVHEGAGHFHVIADDGCVDPGAAVAKDLDHVHFGKGTSEGTIYLGPGEHELCLQPGNGEHVALDETDTVSITVGVESREDWCGVIGEVDELFTTTDTSSDEFAVKQAAYGGIVRLIAQLTAGLEHVDEDVREAVGAALQQGSEIAQTFVDAADGAAAGAALRAKYGETGAQPDPVASEWIRDNCDVDIDS
jgi:hypothetical protein